MPEPVYQELSSPNIPHIKQRADKSYLGNRCLRVASEEAASNKIYRLDHAVSKTQKVVLSAFRISVDQVKYQSNYISDSLKGKGLGE